MNFHTAQLVLVHLQKQEQKIQSQIDRLELQKEALWEEKAKIKAKVFVDSFINLFPKI